MTFTIIPAIDILNGAVVRLRKGDYNEATHYPLSVAELAKRYETAGAKRIHVVDLDGAKAGDIVNWDAIQEIRNIVNCDIEVGGGIRSLETLKKLFDIGIQYGILGSILVKNPSLSQQLISHYPNKILAGLDCKESQIATEGWIQTSNFSLEQMLKFLNPLALAGIIFTDIATDGMLCGPNLAMLRQLTSLTPHPIIASGGVATQADIAGIQSISPQIHGCILGKAIMENRVSLNTLFTS